MSGSFLNCLLCVIGILCVNFCSASDEQDAVENLKAFFENYSSWQRQKREAGEEQGNSTFNLNWGYKQEDVIYWVSDEQADFYTGFIKCKQLGMEPVSVITLGQNNQLEKFLKPLVTPEQSAFWMFAQKVGDKDKFYWLNTGKPLAYTKWFVNYPDNWGGDENCLSMLFSTTAGPGWNDVTCNKAMRYVCQKRRSSVAFVLDINKEL